MPKRKTFRNDKAGVEFLRIWQEKGRREARIEVGRGGVIPSDITSKKPGWAIQAYVDGYNAELQRQRVERANRAAGKTLGEVFANG